MPLNSPSLPVLALARRYLHSPPYPCPDLHQFSRCIHQQFARLPVVVEFVDHTPYRDMWSMQAEVRATRRLQITVAHSDSVFPPEVNWQFRAVHDMDHLREAVPFHFLGECHAARMMCRRFSSPTLRQIVFSEIVAQAACVHVSGRFPLQKFVPVPEAVQDQFLALRWS